MKTRPTITRRDLLTGLSLAPLAACGRAPDANSVRVLHIETNREVLSIWQAAARRFTARHPGTNVEFRVMEPKSFQSRMSTLLQSDGRPHLFYSWGGASLDALRAAGLLADITDRLSPDTLAGLMPKALGAYRRQGRLFGLPYLATEIGLIANRAVLEKAGIDLVTLADWPGFLSALARLKQADIPTLAMGGMDQWPLTLILGQLALAGAGADGIATALEDRDGGFEAPGLLAAADRFSALAALDPFQPGYLSTKAQGAMQLFVKGGAALMMHGTWFYRQAGALTGRDPVALAADFPFIGFPSLVPVPATARQGQLNGWLVSTGAPPAAIAFLEELTGMETQAALAAGGHIIPANLSARSALTHPELAAAARRLDAAENIVLSWDQLLGSNGGPTANDVAVRLATGQMGPADAMKAIRHGWHIERRADGLDGAYAGAIADLAGRGTP